MKTVYLFGAGFSKDVASGPLMRECFDRMVAACERRVELASQCRGPTLTDPDQSRRWTDAKFIVHKFARYLCGGELDTVSGIQKLKSAASILEHNLELLATIVDILRRVEDVEHATLRTTRYDQGASFVPGIWKDDTARLWEFITQFLPAALIGLVVREDKLSTFRAFAERLGPESDTLVTFNYDIVLERGLWRLDLWTPNRGYLGLDHFEWEDSEAVTAAVSQRLPRSTHCVLKLHGSVNWEGGGSGPPFVSLRNRDELGQPWCFPRIEEKLQLPEAPRQYEHISWRYQNVLVAPSLVKDIGAEPILAANWRECQRALRQADQIVVIGYSFPEQDNASRLLLTLLRDDARMAIVGPHATGIAGSIQHLVNGDVVPHDSEFSRWVEDGCPILLGA